MCSSLHDGCISVLHMVLMICRFGTITDNIELHGKDLKKINNNNKGM